MTTANTEALLAAADAPPALYGHCVKAYTLMYKRAERDSATGIVIYEGFLVRLFTKDLSLSTPYYSYCMKALKQMGCVRILRRGASGSPSQWQLMREPTLELFLNQVPESEQKSTARIRQGKDKFEAMQSRVDALQTKVMTLEEEVERQKQAIIRLTISRSGKKDVSNG